MIGKLRRLAKVGKAAIQLGPKNLWLFAQHRMRTRNGYYERTCPAIPWDQVRANEGKSPFANPAEVEIHRSAEAVDFGDRIVAGELLFFGRHWHMQEERWLWSASTDFTFGTAHWSKIPDFDPKQGDVKFVWEPSRFDWVHGLARAWRASGDEKYRARFWKMFESWYEQNLPNQGPNWKCGQESSLRMMAMIFAIGVFGDGTAEQTAKLWKAVTALAGRVDVAIGYAIAQKNNHALSEAAGLYLAGTALKSHPDSARWRARGRAVMEEQVREQFLADGSYIQSSHNYTRVALRDVLLFALTCHANNDPLPAVIKQRALAALDLLRAVQNPETGRVPNYGANDGANIFDLSGLGYLDYRPLIQSLTVALTGERAYEPGPWDEELAWFGLDAAKSIRTVENVAFTEGGYFVVRGENSYGVVRCHSFKTNPSHADMLALDLWHHGVNLLPDGGTFQYFDATNRGEFFKSTAAHSTIEINGQSQMEKGTRFMWSEWTQSKLRSSEPFDGEHYGYQKLFGVVHRRRIEVFGDVWVVSDSITGGTEPVDIVLRWRLAGTIWTLEGKRATGPVSVQVFAEAGETVLLAGESGYPETGESLYYAEISPISVLKTSLKATTATFVTVIGAESEAVAAELAAAAAKRFPASL